MSFNNNNKENKSPYNAINNIMSRYKYDSKSSAANNDGTPNRKRRKSNITFQITLEAYHYPNDNPLKDVYEIKTLNQAMTVWIGVTDSMTENQVREALLTLLQKKFPAVAKADFKYEFFSKIKFQRSIQKVITMSKCDGRFVKETATSKKIYIVMTSPIPGVTAVNPCGLLRSVAASSNSPASPASPITSDDDTGGVQITRSDGSNRPTSSNTNLTRPPRIPFSFITSSPSPPSSPVHQSSAPSSQVPDFLVGKPRRNTGGWNNILDSKIVSLARVFIYNSYFSDSLNKVAAEKVDEGVLTDFELIMIQFMYAESETHQNVIYDEIVKSYRRKIGDENHIRRFLECLESLHRESACWSDYFSLTVSTLVTKYFSTQGEKEVLSYGKYVYPVSKDVFDTRLLEVFVVEHFSSKATDELPTDVAQDCGDDEVNVVNFYTATPQLLVLLPEANEKWNVQEKLMERRIEKMFSCSKGQYQLQSAILSKDEVFFSLIITEDECNVMYKDCEYTLSLDSSLSLLDEADVHLVSYSKTILNSILPLKVNEACKTVGNRLNDRVLASNMSSDNTGVEGSVSATMELKVKRRLAGIYGQLELKEHLHEQIRHIHFGILRSNTPDSLRTKMHMVLTGNPGVGKTEVAKRMAGIFYDIGVSKTDKLVAVTSGDLVAQYIGQTAQKTRAVIKKATSGTLFIDEAYTLQPKSEKSFSREAVEELMNILLNPSPDIPILILAGYQREMRNFMEINPGLKRRIPNTFHMVDYTTDELATITETKLHQQQMEFPININLAEQFDKIPFQIRTIYNAGLCQQLIDSAIHVQEARLPSNLDAADEQLFLLTKDDFEKGGSKLAAKLSNSNDKETQTHDKEMQTELSLDKCAVYV